MSDPRNTAEERRLDWALEELEGLHTPPDLTQRILARMQEDPEAPPARRNRWLVVAALAAGLIVVALIARLVQDTPPESSDVAEHAPLPPARVTSDAEIRRLSAETETVRAVALPDDDELAALTTLHKLRELELVWQRKLSAEGLSHLGSLPILESLTLTGTNTDADGVVLLVERLPNLKSLELRGQPALGDRSIPSLAGMRWLRRLSLVGCGRISTAGLVELSGLRRLEELELAELPAPDGGSAITDDVLVSIERLPKIRSLAVRGASVTDAGVATLAAGSPQLSSIDLRDCAAVTDHGVRALLEDLRVERLYLSGTGVTVDLVEDLLRERSLEHLELRFSWVTPALRTRLESLPRLRLLETEPR